MKTHKELDVWKQSILLARDVYSATRNFPKEETYGLVSQMRRAAVSIASNIAEGAARSGGKEFNKFLYIAVGSASELDTQIEIAKVTRLGDPQKLNELQQHLTRVTQMLYGLIRATKEKV